MWDRCGSWLCIEDWNTTVLRCKKWTKDRKIAYFVFWRVVIKSVYYLEIGDDGLKYLLIIIEVADSATTVWGMPAAVLSHFHRIITAIKVISELWIGIQELNVAGFGCWSFFPDFVSVCLYRFIKRSLKILWAVLSSSLFIYLHLYNLCLINQSISWSINQWIYLFSICSLELKGGWYLPHEQISMKEGLLQLLFSKPHKDLGTKWGNNFLKYFMPHAVFFISPSAPGTLYRILNWQPTHMWAH